MVDTTKEVAQFGLIGEVRGDGRSGLRAAQLRAAQLRCLAVTSIPAACSSLTVGASLAAHASASAMLASLAASPGLGCLLRAMSARLPPEILEGFGAKTV